MFQSPTAKATLPAQPAQSASPSTELNRTAFWLLCLAPTLWMLVFYAFILRMRFELGYWPQPGHPNPLMLDFAGYQTAIYFCTAFALVSPIGVLAFTLLHRGMNLAIRRPLMTFGISGLLLAVVIHFDPAHFLRWFGS